MVICKHSQDSSPSVWVGYCVGYVGELNPYVDI